MEFRFATERDALFLLEIYKQYIESAITFEFELPSEETFKNRIRNISKDYPYIVCEDNKKIVGYAYASKFKTRQAYQWDSELSIYIDKTYTSKGIGKKFYNMIIDILKLQEIRNIYGCVTVPNERSEGLHKSLGFKRVALYNKAGYKCNKWHDVEWFEKTIGEYNLNPKPFVSISKIPEKDLKEILTRK